MSHPSYTASVPVTDTEIADLRDEAGQAGDLEMATLCEIALGGREGDEVSRQEARHECERVILTARAEAGAPERTAWPVVTDYVREVARRTTNQ